MPIIHIDRTCGVYGCKNKSLHLVTGYGYVRDPTAYVKRMDKFGYYVCEEHIDSDSPLFMRRVANERTQP